MAMCKYTSEAPCIAVKWDSVMAVTTTPTMFSRIEQFHVARKRGGDQWRCVDIASWLVWEGGKGVFPVRQVSMLYVSYIRLRYGDARLW